MDIPPPAVPTERLADWRRTESTVEEAFSTPMLTVHTHTHVYEETAEREAIDADAGVDRPWRFFFASRVRLEPATQPSALLTKLIARKATASFRDRLSARGFERIDRRREHVSFAGERTDGTRVDYRAVCRLRVADDTVSLPVAAAVAVWDAGGDYHLAGGGYPTGPPDSAPAALREALATHTDLAAASDTLETLLDACVSVSRNQE